VAHSLPPELLVSKPMPHISIDYSANLARAVDFDAFCDHMRKTAGAIEIFEVPGIRVRAIAVDHYSIADGNPEHGYIDISVRLREGRPLEARREAAQTLFEAAEGFLRPVLDTRSLALSLEMRDIDAALSPKTGTIRNYLGGA
jgi:5-carboxymethyl-2-hydroxymuconate isomerase